MDVYPLITCVCARNERMGGRCVVCMWNYVSYFTEQWKQHMYYWCGENEGAHIYWKYCCISYQNIIATKTEKKTSTATKNQNTHKNPKRNEEACNKHTHPRASASERAEPFTWQNCCWIVQRAYNIHIIHMRSSGP